MEQGFSILIAVMLLAVLAVLLLGLVSLARGGNFSKKYGNKLMRARILLQLPAVLLLLAVYFFWRH